MSNDDFDEFLSRLDSNGHLDLDPGYDFEDLLLEFATPVTTQRMPRTISSFHSTIEPHVTYDNDDTRDTDQTWSIASQYGAEQHPYDFDRVDIITEPRNDTSLPPPMTESKPPTGSKRHRADGSSHRKASIKHLRESTVCSVIGCTLDANPRNGRCDLHKMHPSRRCKQPGCPKYRQPNFRGYCVNHYRLHYPR